MADALDIGILLFPNATQLDAMGPAQVLSRLPEARLHIVGKTRDPVTTDCGFAILPTVNYANCPQLDVVCVPGGVGQVALMNDEPTLSFLCRQAEKARYVTSVCTGSLVLAAAGLLKGYRAACHWSVRDELAAFGAVPVAERVVRDRNRISGGGVTAGIDFGLTLAAELAGEKTARAIQLMMEYYPHPPFDSGSPEKAGPELVDFYRQRTSGMMEQRCEANRTAAARVVAQT